MPTLYGTIAGAHVEWDDASKLIMREYLAKHPTRRVRGELVLYHPTRTVEQNKLLHRIYRQAIAQKQEGYTVEELHDTFKAMFCKDENGFVRSTKKQTTVEFMGFVEKVVRVLVEMGNEIDLPEDWR